MALLRICFKVKRGTLKSMSRLSTNPSNTILSISLMEDTPSALVLRLRLPVFVPRFHLLIKNWLFLPVS